MSLLKKMRACRAMPVVLAMAWLPFVATRCIETPWGNAGCAIWPAADQAHAAEHHGRKAAATGPHRHARHEHQRGRTCCQLTGKCDISIAAGVQSLTPIQLVAMLPEVFGRTDPHEARPHRRPAPSIAHAPPTYLRNATLLI